MIYYNNASAWTSVYLGDKPISKVYSHLSLVFPYFKVKSVFTDSTSSSITCDHGTYGVLTAEDVSYGGGSERKVKTVSAVVGDCVTETIETFSGCTNMVSATLPETIVVLGNRTFQGCSGLTSITIPSGVTTIGNNVFQDCSGLTSVTIPSGVTQMSFSVFFNCSNLTSVTFQDGCQLSEIDNAAFYNCGMASITIPSVITRIGMNGFGQCRRLSNVMFQEGSQLDTIESMAFQGCSGLTSITIPSGVTSIGYDAFRNCVGLESVTVLNAVPPTLGNNAVFLNTNNCPIYVPSGSVDRYKRASNWAMYANRIQAIPNT